MRHPPGKARLESLFVAAEYFEDRGDLETAFRCLLAGARAGHEGCMLNLGNFYSNGTGVGRDLAQAAYWYRRNHAAGSSTGARNLAIDYRNSGNLRAAVTWFRKALARKDGSSAIELAKMLLSKGARVEAAELLRRVHTGDLSSVDSASELDREEAGRLLKRCALPARAVRPPRTGR